jgi:hypothetical protein
MNFSSPVSEYLLLSFLVDHILLSSFTETGLLRKPKIIMDTQKTINEIIELLDTLWEDYPINTQAEIDAKENLRQRIEALQQNRDTEDISLRA